LDLNIDAHSRQVLQFLLQGRSDEIDFVTFDGAADAQSEHLIVESCFDEFNHKTVSDLFD
jgi:hypothetical protein